MATNKPNGDNARIGAVKDRTQFQTPSGLWAKRNSENGQIMDVKTSGGKFKGVRKEK
jgi:hypothetical protein